MLSKISGPNQHKRFAFYDRGTSVTADPCSRRQVLNIRKWFAIFPFGVITPARVFASDFSVLGVALGSLVIAVILTGLGIKAFMVGRAKGRSAAAPFLVFVAILIFVGVVLVVDEAAHMAKTDFYGFLAAIVVPGALAFFVPILTARGAEETDERKST